MSLTRIKDAAVRVIRELPNRPTGTGHMTAAALKAAFDQAAENIKTAVNQMISQLESSGGAAEIGFRRSAEVPADTVQDAIENVQSQIAGVALGSIPDGSITSSKLQSDSITENKIKDGSVTNLKIAKDALLEEVTDRVTLTGITRDGVTPARISTFEFFYCRALGIVFVRGYMNLTVLAGDNSVEQHYSWNGFNPKSSNDLFSVNMIRGYTISDTELNQANVKLTMSYNPETFRLVFSAEDVPYSQSIRSIPVKVSGWYLCEDQEEEVSS